MPDQTIQPTSPPLENEPFTIDEIIGRPPGWILHSGMTVLFIVVTIAIAMTFVIRYPDKIQATGVITTVDPFKTIIAKTTGIVDTVFVQHDVLISEDEPILYVENTANRGDVEDCMEQVHQLENVLDENMQHRIQLKFISSGWTDNYTLGPLQSTFASLDQQIREFKHFLQRDDYALKLEAINREIEEIQNLNKVLEQEKALTAEEVTLSEIDVQRNQQLLEHGVISKREMERSEAGHFGIRKNYLLKGNSMAQNRIRIAGLEQQKTEIIAARQEQLLLYRSRLSEIILNLKNQYRQWKLQYYVDAPASGKVQLSSAIVPGQTITSGQPAGYVIPQGAAPADTFSVSNPKYAKVFVPSAGIGKIEPGNRVILRLEAYPYKEYGSIDSQVGEIYPIADVRDGASIYEVHIPLPHDLRTDYGYAVRYTPEMPVHVSIIAEERSLFARIFDQFFNLINHHTTMGSASLWEDKSDGRIAEPEFKPRRMVEEPVRPPTKACRRQTHQGLASLRVRVAALVILPRQVSTLSSQLILQFKIQNNEP